MDDTASSPDKTAFLQDLEGGLFAMGVARGDWGLVELNWPDVILWLKVPMRGEAVPDRFYVHANCAGYPSKSPTGTFWEPVANAQLAPERWPKGRARVKSVFRTDWENGQAFYHPFDRFAMEKHPDWPQKYAGMLWTPSHTVGEWLATFHDLLNSDEYTGV